MFIVVGKREGEDTAYVGPAADTIKDAAEKFYLYACALACVNPEAEVPESAWHEELIDSKCLLEKSELYTPVYFDADNSVLVIQKIPEGY